MTRARNRCTTGLPTRDRGAAPVAPAPGHNHPMLPHEAEPASRQGRAGRRPAQRKPAPPPT
jgi:hypothetical protein